MNDIRCDILIVGSGAAGGVLAATLAEGTNKKIILLEKGGYYGREFFNQREWDMNVLYADSGTRSTVDGAMPIRGGECVGGGTTINIALCFDPVREVWEGWKRTHGVKGLTFSDSGSDYGVPGLSVGECLREIRTRIHVHVPDETEVNDNNRILREGCSRLGIGTNRFELNMRGCIGCGFCAEGCSYDYKQGTMVTYIADAVQKGVQLIHHCSVDGVEWSGDGDGMTATGVRAVVRPTEHGSRPNTVDPGPYRITAQLVILSCGAIESPSLLLRSGHPDPASVLGKGLVIHPSLPIAGVFDRPLTNYRGISGTIYSDHFYGSHGFYFECLFGHPVYGSVVLPYVGRDHFELMLKFGSIAGFGVMLIDTVDPSNLVEWDRSEGTAAIRYALSEGDKKRLRYAAQKGVEIMFAAGAKEVLLPSEEPIGPLPVPRFRDVSEAAHCEHLQFLPHQTTITSAHCQATVKMGEVRERSMINSRCESHFVKNLIVCDSSSFPTSCGANPMISIMTLARYQGRRIAAEWGRYGS